MTIWKFGLPIADRQTIHMPRGAKVLDVQAQNGVPQMWVLCDPSEPLEPRQFAIFGTGHSAADAIHEHYVGTFQMLNGALVWHLFEVAP